jgi:hypothetical protein
MQAKETLTTLCGLSREETALDFSGQYLVAGDAVLIANEISDMRALLVLSLRDNSLANKEGGRALAQALASNSTLKELDVSGNWRGGDGPGSPGGGDGFAQELAAGIKDNGAMTKLDARNNTISDKGKRALKKAAGVVFLRTRYLRLKFASRYRIINNARSFSFRRQDRTSTLRLVM